MRKVILLGLICASCAATSSLRSKFPHGLLTDAYGILLEKDLQIYTEEADPVPLAEFSGSYGRWVCAPIQNIVVDCRDLGPQDPIGELYGDIDVVVTIEQASFVFGGRHGIPMDSCKAKIAIWKNLMRQQSHACVAGYSAGRPEQAQGKVIHNFVWDRFKTLSGEDHWFEVEASK